MDPLYQGVLAATFSFFIVTILFAILIFVCKKSKTNNVTATRNTTRTVPSSVSLSETASFDPSVPDFSLSDLVKATENFSPDLIIGDGSFGLVYKANLWNFSTYAVMTVAVKKLSVDAFQGFREFRAEMETLGKIRHPNIVKILGYCATDLDRILIYEYIEKGSLDQWLCDTSSGNNDSMSEPKLPLSWETRLSIIGDVAKGLCFMHNLEIPIIHRDIKASNVLLDSKFRAHIADFGLARRMEDEHSHVSTQVAGTMGYMPPEYFHGSMIATPLGDVYSFGVLMLEVATGRRPNWPVKDEDGKEIRIVKWCTKMVEQKKEMEIIDCAISQEDLKQKQVVEFFRIALLCIDEAAPKQRPSMNKVVQLLDGISKL
ncbi:Phytosulfokine receptor 2 [Heracleum sosnowskyi]|uniref:Phytosulfokine receptor 2 n=1 Tax=Heracleum sosnowskyi TaxID=360622 RepID=A0AAD8JGR3_9APIA|nr:Phytosulfokine receptor 2 [Heracleum sosnowskyi]